jgi:hypothetical protein
MDCQICYLEVFADSPPIRDVTNQSFALGQSQVGASRTHLQGSKLGSSRPSQSLGMVKPSRRARKNRFCRSSICRSSTLSVIGAFVEDQGRLATGRVGRFFAAATLMTRVDHVLCMVKGKPESRSASCAASLLTARTSCQSAAALSPSAVLLPQTATSSGRRQSRLVSRDTARGCLSSASSFAVMALSWMRRLHHGLFQANYDRTTQLNTCDYV